MYARAGEIVEYNYIFAVFRKEDEDERIVSLCEGKMLSVFSTIQSEQEENGPINREEQAVSR